MILLLLEVDPHARGIDIATTILIGQIPHILSPIAKRGFTKNGCIYHG